MRHGPVGRLACEANAVGLRGVQIAIRCGRGAMRVSFRRLTVVTLVTLGPSLASAQQSGASVHPVPAPALAASTRTGTITVDGRLDEGAWQAATPIADF